MKYKNTKTGAIIDSPFKISGGDWVELKKEDKPKAKKVEEVKKESKKEEIEEVEKTDEIEDGGPDGIKKKEIMQELDAFGVEYNPRSKKQELYDLMIQSR